MQKDIETTWQGLDPGSWDLVHTRTLNGSIANWPKVYAEAFRCVPLISGRYQSCLLTAHRHLKPDSGYFEQVEIDWTPRCDDDSMQRDAYVVQWTKEVLDAMDGFGRPLRLNSSLTKRQLAEAGFVDIQEEVLKLPVNGWPTDAHLRDIGRWFNLGMRQAYQPLSLAPLCRGHKRTPAEIFDITEKVREEVFSTKVHAYCTL